MRTCAPLDPPNEGGLRTGIWYAFVDATGFCQNSEKNWISIGHFGPSIGHFDHQN